VTKEIAVIENKLPVAWTNVQWTPWINVREGDETIPGLALHQHLDRRGGLGDEQRLNVFVCIREPGAPKVDYTEFSVTKQ